MLNLEKAVLGLLLGDISCKGFKSSLGRFGTGFVLEYAAENQLLFALSSKLSGKSCLSQADAKKVGRAFETGNKLHSDRLLLAGKAQSVFEKAGCDTVLMKSFFPFPYADDDLDFVAVKGNCRKALEDAGFAMVENRSYLREPLKRFFSPKGSNCVVHLHSAFSWNGIVYLDSGSVLKGGVSKKIGASTITVPGPTHDLLITAGHAFFENKCIYTADFLNTILLVKSGKVDWNRLFLMAGEFNWKLALVYFLLHIEALHQQIFGKSLFPEKLLKDEKPVVLTEKILFPLIFRHSGSISFRKLLLDFFKLRFRQLPRQFFSYTAVDFMLHRLVSKSKARLEVLSC